MTVLASFLAILVSFTAIVMPSDKPFKDKEPEKNPTTHMEAVLPEEIKAPKIYESKY